MRAVVLDCKGCHFARRFGSPGRRIACASCYSEGCMVAGLQGSSLCAEVWDSVREHSEINCSLRVLIPCGRDSCLEYWLVSSKSPKLSLILSLCAVLRKCYRSGPQHAVRGCSVSHSKRNAFVENIVEACLRGFTHARMSQGPASFGSCKLWFMFAKRCASFA